MKRSGRKKMICHNLAQEADTGKALNKEVGKQLMAHRDRQLELQKEHEERIARMLERNKGFFFLSEKSQKTGSFPFLRFFARTFPSYDRHLLCYLFLYLFLFIEYLHDSIQQFFFFSQQLAYAVYTLAAAGSGLILFCR